MKFVLLFLALSLCHHQALSFAPVPKSYTASHSSSSSSSSLLRSSESHHCNENYQIIDRNDAIFNDKKDNNCNTKINRRSAISATTGIITSSILLSQSQFQLEPANAATTENPTAARNGPPLDVLVNKIEKGKYFGPDVIKMKNKEPQFAPNSNGAPEKHLPNVVVGGVDGTDLEISVNHVMTDEHYIQFMWLRDVNLDEVVLVKALTSSEERPVLKAKVPKGVTLVPCLYCNLHGLWKGEAFTVA